MRKKIRSIRVWDISWEIMMIAILKFIKERDWTKNFKFVKIIKYKFHNFVKIKKYKFHKKISFFHGTISLLGDYLVVLTICLNFCKLNCRLSITNV